VQDKGPLLLSNFLYQLPDSFIAKYPLPVRDNSRLLQYKNGEITEGFFKDIPALLPSDSNLAINNSQVIHARLLFRTENNAPVEIFCLSPHDPADYEKSFSSGSPVSWYCMAGNLKKWKKGQLLLESPGQEDLKAEKVSINAGKVIVRFTWKGNRTFAEMLDNAGVVPIPPYLNRDAEMVDNERYQTVYARNEGSVAAPTAGLHFTPDTFRKLGHKGIRTLELTLHVGAGTFQPIKDRNIYNHEMHAEWFTISTDTLKRLAFGENPLIATGTTTLRTLESLYWLSVLSARKKEIVSHLNQWEYMNIHPEVTFREALSELVSLMEKHDADRFSASTSMMIVPGYDFRSVDILITNFHQPMSTLLLLVAAFIGDDWKRVYDYALCKGFRFLSYGDSSLLFRT